MLVITRLRVPLVTALALGALLAAPATASPPPARAARNSASVTLRSFHIGLSKSSFKVPRRGGNITFNIHNAARDSKHGFKTGGSAGNVLRPGRSKNGVKFFLKPRRKAYTFFCPVDGHRSLGMVVKVKVSKR